MSYLTLALIIVAALFIIGGILTAITKQSLWMLLGIGGITIVLFLAAAGFWHTPRTRYYATEYNLDSLYSSFEQDPNYKCTKITKVVDNYYDSPFNDSISRDNANVNKIYIIDQIGPDKVKYIVYEPSDYAKKKLQEHEAAEQYKLPEDTDTDTDTDTETDTDTDTDILRHSQTDTVLIQNKA